MDTVKSVYAYVKSFHAYAAAWVAAHPAATVNAILAAVVLKAVVSIAL